LADPAQDTEGLVLVDVSVSHEDAHRHADPAVAHQGVPQLGDLGSQVWRRGAVDVRVGAGVVFLAVNESGQGI